MHVRVAEQEDRHETNDDCHNHQDGGKETPSNGEDVVRLVAIIVIVVVVVVTIIAITITTTIIITTIRLINVTMV